MNYDSGVSQKELMERITKDFQEIYRNIKKYNKYFKYGARMAEVKKYLAGQPPEYIQVLAYLIQNKNSLIERENIVKRYSPNHPEPIETAIDNIIADFPNHVEIDIGTLSQGAITDMSVQWSDRQIRPTVLQRGIYKRVHSERKPLMLEITNMSNPQSEMIIDTSEVPESKLGDEEYVQYIWDANLHDR